MFSAMMVAAVLSFGVSQVGEPVNAAKVKQCKADCDKKAKSCKSKCKGKNKGDCEASCSMNTGGCKSGCEFK
jgi:hypothetical protein